MRRLQPVYNMVPSCSAQSAVNSTAVLRAVLGTTATNGGINFGTSDLQCTSQVGPRSKSGSLPAYACMRVSRLAMGSEGCTVTCAGALAKVICSIDFVYINIQHRQCWVQVANFLPDAEAINSKLYCGFYQVPDARMLAARQANVCHAASVPDWGCSDGHSASVSQLVQRAVC